MRRSASVIVLGGIAIAAAAYGVGCSSEDAQPGADAGADHAVGPVTDSGPTTLSCNGSLPTLSVRTAAGTQAAPDWSCYTADAGGPLASALRVQAFRPSALADDAGDDAGDAGEDAADAETPDSGTDSGPATDSGADAAPDASGGTDAGSAYEMAMIEFVTHQPVPNAAVDIFFGQTTKGTPDRTGTTDSTGIVAFAPPPGGGIGLLSYRATGDGLFPVRFYALPMAPLPYKTAAFSINTGNANSLFSSVLGAEPPRSDASIIVVSMRDCQERDVQGVQVELIDDVTTQPVPTSSTVGGTRTVYFGDTGLPDPRCLYTVNGSQAIWTMLNGPVNMPDKTHGYTVRIKGRVTAADTTPKVLLETPMELWAGESIVPRPYRTTLQQ